MMRCAAPGHSQERSSSHNPACSPQPARCGHPHLLTPPTYVHADGTVAGSAIVNPLHGSARFTHATIGSLSASWRALIPLNAYTGLFTAVCRSNQAWLAVRFTYRRVRPEAAKERTYLDELRAAILRGV